MFAICNPQPNWIPKKPKLMFQICQNVRDGLSIKCSYQLLSTANRPVRRHAKLAGSSSAEESGMGRDGIGRFFNPDQCSNQSFLLQTFVATLLRTKYMRVHRHDRSSGHHLLSTRTTFTRINRCRTLLVGILEVLGESSLPIPAKCIFSVSFSVQSVSHISSPRTNARIDPPFERR